MRSCMICGAEDHLDGDVRNINLYPIGSEGFDCCHSCEMAIVADIRDKMRIAGVSRRAGYLACKTIRCAKEQLANGGVNVQADVL